MELEAFVSPIFSDVNYVKNKCKFEVGHITLHDRKLEFNQKSVVCEDFRVTKNFSSP